MKLPQLTLRDLFWLVLLGVPAWLLLVLLLALFPFWFALGCGLVGLVRLRKGR